jgi:hypothetical protein
MCIYCGVSEQPEQKTVCTECMAAREDSPIFKAARATSLMALAFPDPRWL